MNKTTRKSISTIRRKSTKINSKRDPVAKELRTPKYRSQVVPNKKKHLPPIEEL